MKTRHGTDLISSMPDFLQMVWVDTKKQLKQHLDSWQIRRVVIRLVP